MLKATGAIAQGLHARTDPSSASQKASPPKTKPEPYKAYRQTLTPEPDNYSMPSNRNPCKSQLERQVRLWCLEFTRSEAQSPNLSTP